MLPHPKLVLELGGQGFSQAVHSAVGRWATPPVVCQRYGKVFEEGSDLVVQVHYHPTGKKEIDQSEVGLYFVNKPWRVLQASAKLVGAFGWPTMKWIFQLARPITNANIVHAAKDVIMVGVVPHMHLLGKSMRVTATQPNREPETPHRHPRMELYWQDEYYYEQRFV